MPDTHTNKPDPAADEQTPRAHRGWRIAAIVLVVLAMVALGALGSLLFAGTPEAADNVRACIPTRVVSQDESGTHVESQECPPKGAKQTDGLVQKTDEGSFTIREIRAGKLADSVTLHVREPDRPYIDIAHAQTHAALGQPIRVFTLEIDGVDSVVYMTDPPADFS
ncbi:MAG: hypothetical protein ABI200_03565 [Gaiellales bacterium]